ncbi:RIP metalloprotease RseP [Candidatus Uhrbacteria bacterium]|nr:RIP metalloprotease RseP [Candidatus Uhrbacteria bacterium]
MTILITIILFVAILSILVLIHEFGHFIVARFFGVHVEEFGIGFPPRAWGKKKGNTVYSLNWVPLGGFVKLKGEQGESHDSDSFASKKIWQRVCILAAGVFMNLALTVGIFFVGFLVGMPQALDGSNVSGAYLRDEKIHVTQVLNRYPADKAGMKPGDALLSIDGQSFKKISDIQQYMKEHAGKQIQVSFSRGSESLQTILTPVYIQEGGSYGIGVGLAHTAIVSYPFVQAFFAAVNMTFVMALNILVTLGNAIRHLAFDGFVGPVGIAVYTATVTKLGFVYIFNLIAQLSLSLAIINFLPIPALDGGRVFFAVLEKIRGRAMAPLAENAIHLSGFVLLIALLLLVTVRDVMNLF